VRRGPLTRKQILDASLRLFSEKGFARTSVRDIAHAAGITDAAISYHFASKRELFEALFEERGITSALTELERAVISAPPCETFTGIARSALNIMQRNRDFMKVLFSEATNEDPIASEDYRMVTERWRKAMARMLGDFVEQEQLPAMDVELVSKQLVELPIGAFLDQIMSGESRQMEEASPELVARVSSAVERFVIGLQANGA
jgi:AcrR family transcriptional regulator